MRDLLGGLWQAQWAAPAGEPQLPGEALPKSLPFPHSPHLGTGVRTMLRGGEKPQGFSEESAEAAMG